MIAGVSFPRVPGIEAAGTVDAAPPGSGLVPGQKVVAMMGDMGRTYDGGYAEYTSVPLSQVIPVDTDLPWEVLGALPEMVQTAYGSLTVGLDLQPDQSVLIRGGTSSVGLAARGARARHGLLRRQPVQPVDGAGLLPERVPAPGRAPGGLLRRRRRPASGDVPGDPRRGRGRPAHLPGGPRLRRPGAGAPRP